MDKRKFPQFFDQVPSLAMMEYAAEEEEQVRHGGMLHTKKPKKVKRPAFVPCQDCAEYAPKEDGGFGCRADGKCIHI